MFKKIQAKLKNKKGFTLVELLIVIAVLGIIAAIAVPRFTGVLAGVRGSADDRAAELLAKEIEAEFMTEAWTVPATGTLAVGPVANDDRAGFNGVLPVAQSTTTAMAATIARDAASATGFTLVITDGAATPRTLETRAIQGPIQ